MSDMLCSPLKIDSQSWEISIGGDFVGLRFGDAKWVLILWAFR